VALGVGALVVISALALFNALVSARQRVRESWADVDVELARRRDLIPNLVATVKGYTKHEAEVLRRLTELRGEAEALRPGPATDRQASVEGALGGTLRTVMMRAEAYPDLKAADAFLALQGELAHTEDRIAAALRFYNGNVRDLNTRCESLPSAWIASLGGFRPARYFELRDRADAAVPGIDV
jgi:LemA protein